MRLVVFAIVLFANDTTGMQRSKKIAVSFSKNIKKRKNRSK